MKPGGAIENVRRWEGWQPMGTIMSQSYPLLSGYSMPVFGLGTWLLNGSACERAVSMAIQLGYRLIDTAELYGNEGEIGRAIRGMDRSTLFITDKVSSAHLSTSDLIDACVRSLDHLGTDYLDLYLIHWPNDAIPIPYTMEGMQYLVAERLVRSVGVSNFDVARLQEVIKVSEVPVCNDQVEYHPYRPRHQIPEFCREHKIALTAYCPLAKGAVLHDPVLARIGRRYDKSAAQVSLRWLLQKGAIVIPKAGSLDHLKANMDLDGWELSPDQMQEIDDIGIEAKVVDTVYT
jgi:2,5-diketo-D-gluconate reductase B